MDPETRLHVTKLSIAEGHRQAQLERAARRPRPAQATTRATKLQLRLGRFLRQPAGA